MLDKSKNEIVILGGGVTGLTLAKELSERHRNKVTVIEKESFLGGMASTLSEGILSFDLGSHRLHKDISPKFIRYFEEILQERLLKRPRKGKLYVRGRFLSYPPNIFSLVKDLSVRGFMGLSKSYLKKFFSLRSRNGDNFEDTMIRRVGREIYEIFYKDYANKLWGKDPRQISINSMKKKMIFMNLWSLGKALFKKNDYFYYPKYGIGQIARKLEKSIMDNNCRIIKGAQVKQIIVDKGKVSGITVETSSGDKIDIDVSILISTIALDELFGLIFENEQVGYSLEWRDLRILYILVEKNIKSESDTFYFPTSDIIFGRVSEIGKFSPHLNASIKNTLLTIEIPLNIGDAIWNMGEQELLDLCLADLIKVGILDKGQKVIKHFSLKLEKAYPIYNLGWKENFFKIYDKLAEIENLFTIGRKGLFLQCNIDHCIIQGTELANFILKDGWQGKNLWHKKALNFLKLDARD